ncbi:f-box domain-containing protein [Gigaspora margarita]|uniref:F-box domain-containing protein n=1 Tax=Gigaspora margarita TaxID=4874 RepID=A0A8H4AXE9_GIGMA|nr:f-box domain-containing protein [Gigaspora margarita]
MIKLPNECFVEIFNNFQNMHDYKNLYSCLLVNRQWCRTIIPILWKRPLDYSRDTRLIRIYLLELNAKEQSLLIPYKIILPNCPKPLFEYSSYTTYVGEYFPDGVENWLDDEGFGTDVPRRFCDREPYFDCFKYYGENEDLVIRAIECSLVAMFLRTSKNLKGLSLYRNIINNIIFESLYTNATLINLSLCKFYFDSEETKGLIELISKNSTLTSLELSDNHLGFEEVKALSEAISKNTALTSLQFHEDQSDLRRIEALV